ncbi:type II toxin-antitoxin system prevent-host-death family antitoxin [Candidatus Gottesmanbacteria bacterium]|nr:type II toxin-antitoxin system prevent-host-death family antitoxin [Candidatus Gottesmanbacteria bacterium]
MEISLQKIIPFTQARNMLSDLVDRVRKEQFFIISKQNRQKAVLVDIDYFQNLQKELEQERLAQIEDTLRSKFQQYTKKIKRGKTLTEEEAYQILSGKKLTW